MGGVPYSHSPAGFFGGSGRDASDSDDEDRGPFTLQNKDRLDPLVKWSHKTAELLRTENSGVIKALERNRKYYDGDQWSANRAAWKNNAVVNYCSYVVDHWTALLTDNKPQFVYEATRMEDQQQAEIATALRDYDSSRDEWDMKREEAVLYSRVDGLSYMTLRPDPGLHQGEGGITLKRIGADQLFKNKGAEGIDDAKYLLYEYFEDKGALLSRFGTLREFEKSQKFWPDEPDDGFQEGEVVGVPAQYVTSTAAPGHTYEPSRTAPGAARPGGGSKGCRVREWWLRPKGPNNQIKVKSAKWKANGSLATARKFIDFEDGTSEPLQTVIVEGNVVYELPLSVAMIMEHAGQFIGCPKVLDRRDAMRAITSDKKVPLYPNGRRIIVVGDCVADDGANPFMHGEFPFVELRARKHFSRGFCGDIDLIYSEQEYLNRLYALLMDCAQLTANPITLLPISSDLADEDITNAPGAILRGDPMMVKLFRRIEGQNMPSYVFQLLTFTIQQIREISGLSEVATGGKFKGQQAAETVSMYQEAAGIIFRQGIRHMEACEVRLGRQYLSLAKQFYSEPRELRVKDALGIDRHIMFHGGELTKDMTMKSKAGSQLPSSPSARLNTMMQLFGQGLTDMPEVTRYLQEAGAIESATALMKRLESYIKNPQDAWKAPALYQMLNGGKKEKKGNQKNAGRSARSTTANKAKTAG